MKTEETDDNRILRIMNDPAEIRKILQSAINQALLKHKQAGNPVCEWKNGKVV